MKAKAEYKKPKAFYKGVDRRKATQEKTQNS